MSHDELKAQPFHVKVEAAIRRCIDCIGLPEKLIHKWKLPETSIFDHDGKIKKEVLDNKRFEHLLDYNLPWCCRKYEEMAKYLLKLH